MKLPQIEVTPFRAGLVLGLGAALVQAYFNVIPPVANGFCMVCHPRDLFNWIANALFDTDWPVTMASLAYPFLTAAGVLAGSAIAAWRHKELKARPVKDGFKHFIYGFLMLHLGLLLSACPIRIVFLSAYGSLAGLAGWAAVAAGAVAVTLLIRRRALCAAEKEG